jgi:hypothetical protein
MNKNIEFWTILKLTLNQKSLFNSSNDPKFGHLCYHLNSFLNELRNFMGIVFFEMIIKLDIYYFFKN